MRTRSLVSAIAFAMLATAGVAQARTTEVEITVAPPPDREYIVPPPRQGYVYERPHYEWDGHQYVWTDGRFIEERPGHVYEQPRIVERGEHHYLNRGHWDDD